MSAPQIIFINKNARSKTLSRAEGRQRSIVYSHVQNRPRLSSVRKEAASQNAIRAEDGSDATLKTVSPLLQWVQLSQTSLSQGDQSTRRVSGTCKALDQQVDLPVTKSTASSSPTRQRRKQPTRRLHSSAYSSPTTVITANTIDPFNCMPVYLTPSNLALLRHYFGIVQHNGRIEPATCASCKHTTESFHDPLHMYTLLASSAARFRDVENVKMDHRETPEYYNAQALTLLRQKMASNARAAYDRYVMLDILRLAACEWYMHRTDAARIHVASFTHIWNSLDLETSPFDLHVHNCIAVNDIVLAASMNKTPVLKPHRTTAMLITLGSTCNHKKPIYKGSALIRVCQSLDVCPTLQGIIYRVISFSNLSEAVPNDATMHTYPRAESDATHADGKTRAFSTRRHLRAQIFAFMHDILSFRSLCPLEQSIKWTLFIIMLSITTFPRWLHGKLDLAVLADRLKRKLQLQWRCQSGTGKHISNDKLRSQTWLWICLTGVHASEGDIEKQTWFRENAVCFANELSIATTTELEMNLDEFVFCRCVHTAGLDALTQDMNLSPGAEEISDTIFNQAVINGHDLGKKPCIHDF